MCILMTNKFDQEHNIYEKGVELCDANVYCLVCTGLLQNLSQRNHPLESCNQSRLDASKNHRESSWDNRPALRSGNDFLMM